MEDCIFCKFIKGEIKVAKIYEDDNFFAFLDIRPINPGHTLLIPKKHIDYIFDLEEPLYSEAFKVAKKLSKPIQNVVKSRRIGIAIEGFGVPHVHIHIVPLNRGNELDPNMAKETDPEELEKLAEKIKNNLQ